MVKVGISYNNLGLIDNALIAYNNAIELKPDYSEAYFNKGLALRSIYQYSNAIECFDKALLINPSYAEAWLNKGNTLFDIKKYKLADFCFEKSISIRPDYSQAWFNKGNLFFELKNFESSINYYKKTVEINPKIEFGKRSILATSCEICEWSNYKNNLDEITHLLKKNERVIMPISLLCLMDDPLLHKICSEVYVSNFFNRSSDDLKITPARPQKIIIGYFSPDFYNHPVSILTAELFELHDRNRFEIIAFSYGNSPRDEMRQRLESAFDQFHDVPHLSDRQIANLARNIGVEIAVDLAGHTYCARAGIFASRAAPIQISYLGFPGTQGAQYIDYMIADQYVIPSSQRKFYSEKLIYLPFYMINDTKRRVSDISFSRSEMNLPNEGFIYCCFNSNYKLSPLIFDAWLNLLINLPGSVLWLLKENENVVENLKFLANQKGIDASQLIFAERIATEKYLARFERLIFFWIPTRLMQEQLQAMHYGQACLF